MACELLSFDYKFAVPAHVPDIPVKAVGRCNQKVTGAVVVSRTFRFLDASAKGKGMHHLRNETWNLGGCASGTALPRAQSWGVSETSHRAKSSFTGLDEQDSAHKAMLRRMSHGWAEPPCSLESRTDSDPTG